MSDQVALALIAAVPSTLSAIGLIYSRKASLKVDAIHASLERSSPKLCTRVEGHDGPCNGFPRTTCKGSDHV